ncbi:patatin-like phospholipase family protein [Abyssalbus ytuae]|uniref:Patatin-like phospholipase family protein n=1 Tax=Abyssalbus ytuae TaxID=2926907 RepID=A0A9E7D0Q6_9FLAO|nr:patatin-like phospholipase family protein [Abyssalbus ytuae]UOB16268.1 patatin-like phospholipase family protein [Abyssalbus ytuae]
MDNKKIGLTLSGGGVKSLAHAGFLKVLIENNIYPTVLSGTSGGALIAALYASGYHPDEMIRFFKETPLFSFSLFTLNKPGIVDSDKYRAIFKNFFKSQTFEELDFPVTVTATNISTGKLEYFSRGELIKPLIASAALPPYFSPIEIDGDLYSDGGILNNFPTEPVIKNCDVLIGSFVNPVRKIEKKDVNSTLKFLYRVYHISLDANYYRKFKRCNYVFLPAEIEKIGVLDTKMIDKAFKTGYESALKELPKILESL